MQTNKFQYEPIVEPVFTGPETVTESRWHEPWSDPTRRKGPSAALMAASGLSFTSGITSEFIFEDKWHFPWSEPIVKRKIGLRTGDQQSSAFIETPFPSFSWFNNLSDPVRLKVGLHARYQEFLKLQPFPIINIGWFSALSEPKRLRGMRPHEQQVAAFHTNPIISIGWFGPLSEPKRYRTGGTKEQPFAQFFPPPAALTISWFEAFSEPKRFKRRLLESEQEFLFRGAFVPTNHNVVMAANEQRDFFSGVLYQFKVPLTAYVDIIENDPRHRGNLGIIVANPQSGILAGIVEPTSVPSTGAPVSTVAGARVAIITGP